MGRWAIGKWNWKVLWRRNLLDWEKEKENELLQILQSVEVREGVEDRWVWEDKGEGVYTIREAYRLMLTNSSRRNTCARTRNALDCIWNVYAPITTR